MRSMKNLLVSSILILFTASSIGCGSAFEGYNSSKTAGKSTVDVSDALKKAEEAQVAAQKAMLEATEVIAMLLDDEGNVRLDVFTEDTASGVATKSLMDPVISKLREVFDKVFDKVTTVQQQFKLARQKLTEALARLDQNDPTQAALVQQILQQAAALDRLEASFATSMHVLAGKLETAKQALDRAVSGLTGLIPGFGSIVGVAVDFLVMSDIKALITEYQFRLLGI